jgi:hypothetical protein
MFNINLHIDDLDTLKVIAKNLGIGSVTIPDAAHLCFAASLRHFVTSALNFVSDGGVTSALLSHTK